VETGSVSSRPDRSVGLEVSGALRVEEVSGFVSAYAVSVAETASGKTAGGSPEVEVETEFFHGTKYLAQVEPELDARQAEL
jgi:hypothetical protein